MSNELIWTTHAKERLRQRGLNESDVWATWRNPDHSRKATTKDGWIYYKKFGNQKVEVVTKKNERGETLVISVWSRPIYGSYKQESFLKFLWKRIRRAIRNR